MRHTVSAMNHLPVQEIKDFHPFHPGTEKHTREEMMTQVDAVYYQFKRKHHRVYEEFVSCVVLISFLHNVSLTYHVTGSFLRDND